MASNIMNNGNTPLITNFDPATKNNKANSEWNYSIYAGKDNPLSTRRQKRQAITFSVIAGIIVWNIVLAPLISKHLAKDLDVISSIKKCAGRTKERGTLTCIPQESEIWQKNFISETMALIFHEMSEETETRIRHEHKKMLLRIITDEEKNKAARKQKSEAKMTFHERNVLFLLLVKYQLLRLFQVPKLLKRAKDLRLWQNWCQEKISTTTEDIANNQCNNLLIEPPEEKPMVTDEEEEMLIPKGFFAEIENVIEVKLNEENDAKDLINIKEEGAEKEAETKMEIDEKENEKDNKEGKTEKEMEKEKDEKDAEKENEADTKDEGLKKENGEKEAEINVVMERKEAEINKEEARPAENLNNARKSEIKELQVAKQNGKNEAEEKKNAQVKIVNDNKKEEKKFDPLKLIELDEKNNKDTENQMVPLMTLFEYLNIEKEEETKKIDFCINEIRTQNQLTKKLGEKMLRDLTQRQSSTKLSSILSPKKSFLPYAKDILVIEECDKDKAEKMEEKGAHLNKASLARYPPFFRHIIQDTFQSTKYLLNSVPVQCGTKQKFILIHIRALLSQLISTINKQQENEESEQNNGGKNGQKGKKTAQLKTSITKMLDEICTKFDELNKDEWDLPSLKFVIERAKEDKTFKNITTGFFFKGEWQNYEKILEDFASEYHLQKKEKEDKVKGNPFDMKKANENKWFMGVFKGKRGSKFATERMVMEGKATENILPMSENWQYKVDSLRRRKRDPITTAIVYLGSSTMAQVYKHFDVYDIAVRCAKNPTNRCKVPRNITEESEFIKRAKEIVLEELADEMIPKIRRLYEKLYSESGEKTASLILPVLPSKYLAKGGINLNGKQSIFLDCFGYNWKRDTETLEEKTKKKLLENLDVFRGASAAIKKCSDIIVGKKIPKGLKPLFPIKFDRDSGVFIMLEKTIQKNPEANDLIEGIL